MPCRTANKPSCGKAFHPSAPTLKLHADARSTKHTVTAYGPGQVSIDGTLYSRSLLLLPDRIDAGWGPAGFAALAAEHIAALLPLACDVILLGTGTRQRFPAPALLRPLIEAGRGVEVMDTPAACRTYNVLAAEGRRPAAALIVEAA
jgi:uncharacterized protein